MASLSALAYLPFMVLRVTPGEVAAISAVSSTFGGRNLGHFIVMWGMALCRSAPRSLTDSKNRIRKKGSQCCQL